MRKRKNKIEEENLGIESRKLDFWGHGSRIRILRNRRLGLMKTVMGRKKCEKSAIKKPRTLGSGFFFEEPLILKNLGFLDLE